MLIGEHIHTLDDKNRLSLPARFRRELGKSVVVTPGLDNCLFIFTEKEWKRLSGELAERSMLQSDNRSFNRFIFGQAAPSDIDNLGRILVPDYLKNHAGLKSKVALIGVQNRVEIWDKSSWAKYKQTVVKSADTIAEKLGGLGV